MAAIVLGINGKIYITLSGGQGGTFVELTRASDVKTSLTKEEGDATTRAGGGYKQTVGTLKEVEVNFRYPTDNTDTNYNYLRSNFIDAQTNPLGVKVLDKTTGEGPKFDGEVMKFDRDEGNSAVQFTDVTIKVTWSTTAPSWVAAS